MQRTLILILLILATITVSAASNLNLETHRGKVVLLDFWASWCVPCRRSFPWMNEMQHKYADDGLVIIAVNLDQNTDDAARFLEEYPAEFSIHYDPAGVAAKDYQVQVMPSSILFGRDGRVIERHAGFKMKQQDDYEARLQQALHKESDQ